MPTNTTVKKTIALCVFISLASQAIAQETQPALEGEPIAEPRQEQSATAGDQGGEEQTPAAPDLVPTLESIEAAIRDLVSDEDQAERSDQEAREQRDLAAQEQMAWWAQWMFWATFATVLLTFAALVAILRTLHHTRRAADSAEDMVIEAEKTTAAAVQTIQAERAYMTFAGFNIIPDPAPPANGPVLTYSFQPIFLNTGRSPASKEFNVVDFAAVGPGEPPPPFEEAEAMIGEAGYAIHGPGQASHCRPIRVPIATLIACANGQARICLFASVSYEDIFGQQHRTNLCTQVVIRSPPDALLNPLFNTFFFTTIGNQNTAD